MLPPALPISSLASWGAFTGRQRESDSPYIESVWEGTAQRAGVHFTAADAAVDLVFLTRKGVTQVLLSGPTSKAYAEPFDAGDATVTIRFRTGVYVPSMAGVSFTDRDILLSHATKDRFWLQSTSVAFPDFNTAEAFAEYLGSKGLLKRNTTLEKVLQGQPLGNNLRTMQRHSLATTGLTMSRIRQIIRAEQAKKLLGSPYSLTHIAYDVGYSNPGHMTNAFKLFYGRSPSALRKLMQQDA